MKPLKPFYKVLYFIFVFIGHISVRVFFPIRVRGRENVPKRTGFVLAPNHVRAIDPMYILLGYGFHKKMLVMAKAELFANPMMNFLWNCFGGFPIERGAGNRDVLDAAIDEVKGGRGLLIFPEGTRSKDGKLGKLKSGAFVVAQQAGVDIVPCHIHYSAGKPKPFRRITVVFGPPVSMAQLGLEGDHSAKKLRAAKAACAEILNGLAQEIL